MEFEAFHCRQVCPVLRFGLRYLLIRTQARAGLRSIRARLFGSQACFRPGGIWLVTNTSSCMPMFVMVRPFSIVSLGRQFLLVWYLIKLLSKCSWQHLGLTNVGPNSVRTWSWVFGKLKMSLACSIASTLFTAFRYLVFVERHTDR